MTKENKKDKEYIIYRYFLVNGQKKKIHILKFTSKKELDKFLQKYKRNLVIPEIHIAEITYTENYIDW